MTDQRLNVVVCSSDTLELYDLTADPHELTNLVD